MLRSSHPVDFELKAFTFRSLISLGFFLFLSLLTCRICVRLFSARVLHNCCLAVVGLCMSSCRMLFTFFPFLCVQWSVSVCTCRFSDASTSLYEFLLVSASVCMSVCVFACVCERVVLSALADGPSLSSIVPVK